MLKIQKFIQDINDIEIANAFLQEKKSIRVKKCLLPHKQKECAVYIYNYHQYQTDKSDPIGQECRGLILDQYGEIVSMSFPRFFNFGESEAADIDWRGARAEKKEDGTLITIYCHEGEWFVQTRGTAAGEAKMKNGKNDYGTIVKAFLTRKFKNLKWHDPFVGSHLCYVFEFVSPHNKIVTPYSYSDLVLLTIFDKNKVAELPEGSVQEFANFDGFSRPKSKIIDDISDAVKWIGDMEEVEEGLVIVDKHGRRVKMKNLEYLRLAKIVNAGEAVNPKRLLEIVLEDKADDVRIHFPEWEPILTHMEECLAELVDGLYSTYSICRDAFSQKEFAEMVKEHPLSSLLFAKRRDETLDFDDAIKEVKPEKLVELIKGIDEKEFDRRFEDALLPDRNIYPSTSTMQI